VKVLITGAAGYLGRGIYLPFVAPEVKGRYELRLMDVAPFENPPHECVVGSVADLETVRRAVKGCQGIVIAHMASRQAKSYETPVVPFDANVKGTANLFFAAVEEGIKRVALVSSTGVVAASGVVDPDKGPGKYDRRSPIRSKGIYGITKVCQEAIAEQYSREHGIGVGVLRIGCVMDGDTMIDKYGRQHHTRGMTLSDRRDIGEVARLCLEDPKLGYEVFYVMSTPESFKFYDIEYTCKRLNWKPKYDFMWLPEYVPGKTGR